MIQGRPGDAGDLGNGVLGHPEAQEVTDFILLAVEARDTERSLGPAELLAGGPGLGETFTCALRDQVALDFGEQGEERRHDLGLDVLLALDADLFPTNAQQSTKTAPHWSSTRETKRGAVLASTQDLCSEGPRQPVQTKAGYPTRPKAHGCMPGKIVGSQTVSVHF